ncbi:MAG: ATP-binding protein, partial [Proteobacteria bacterium]|nr:ATP-binding protein [Pseudomonadota bacterium]
GGGVEFKDDQQKPWQESGDRCLGRIVTEKNLILVDEFSVFLDKLLERAPEEGVDFLDWLRGWLNDPDIPCRFIFTGSIGLQTLLESHHLTPQMNHCFDYTLGPFKRKHAVEMLRSFTPENWFLESATANHLCDRVGWLSPFYLNLLLNESIQAARDRVLEEPTPPTAPESTDKNQLAILKGDIDDGYERLLAQRSRFIHWENRLKKQLGTDFSLAEWVLTQIALSDPGLNQSQLLARLKTKETDPEKEVKLLQKLIFQLTEEGYLSMPDSEGRVHFLSFLLKDYWKRNHV